jgi:TonB-dependent starch-binding outer membrane protein SusC
MSMKNLIMLIRDFGKVVSNLFTIFFVLLLLCSSTVVFSQVKVEGTILDEANSPMPGVLVIIKGTTTGAITNLTGEFVLNAQVNDIIVMSFIGYLNEEVVVTKELGKLKISMKPDFIGLDEVVAIGYGTLSSKEVTSAIVSVKSEDFLDGAITDPVQLIKGKVAGLQVSRPGGRSTNTSEISLRGISTISSGSSPLIVIDGVPGDLNSVAPEDIETFDVLKDGSASAIYGTRGTNGVILITTKKVKSALQTTTVEINSYYAVSQITKKLNVMSAEQYRRAIVLSDRMYGVDEGYSTDWQDLVLQTPTTHSNNLSVRSGTDKSNFILNVNYKDISGIVVNDNTNVLNTRLEGNYSMFNDVVKLNGHITVKSQNTNSGDFESAYFYSLIYNPTDRPKNDDGTWTQRPLNNYSNPLMLLNETTGKDQNENIRMFGSILVNPISGLTGKVTVSKDSYNNIFGWAHSKQHESTTKSNINAQAGRSASKWVTNLVESTVAYDKTFGEHKINAIAGHSYQSTVGEGFDVYNKDFPTDGITYNDMGAGKGLKDGEAEMGSWKTGDKLAAFFVRVNYNFNYKYMLMLSMRREGSSKFGANNKWGNFPGVSAGWNIKNEPFLKDVGFLSLAKVRAGFGITGTLPSANYAQLSRMSFGDQIFIDGEWIPGMSPSSNPNPNLKWETKQEYNIGLDAGLWNNRLTFSFDWYDRITNDILWEFPVPSPPNVYDIMLANTGTMINKGVEIKIEGTPIKNRDIIYNTSLIFSTNSNKLKNIGKGEFQNANGYINLGYTGEPIQTYIFRLKEDGPVGDFYGWKSVGIDRDGYWIVEDKDGKGISIKDAKEEDKKVIGNGTPKYFLNWNNSLSYKQFDLVVNARASTGFDVLNMTDMFSGVPTGMSRGNVLETAYEPRLDGRSVNVKQNQYFVSEFLEDGSYIRIDNISLGYTFRSISDILKTARVYLNGSNVFTFTNYKGIDPEVSISGLEPGLDNRVRYPQQRTFTLGVQLTF